MAGVLRAMQNPLRICFANHEHTRPRHPGASDTAHTMAHDAPVLPFPAYALWTPPG